MQKNQHSTEKDESSAEKKWTEFFQTQTQISRVYSDRCSKAWERYLDATKDASASLLDDLNVPQARWNFGGTPVPTGWISSQRSILFWDTLRQRGNNWLEHEKAGKPPLLDFEWEMIADARRFERPVNYALVRIIPPADVNTDPQRRPFVHHRPASWTRAGHRRIQAGLAGRGSSQGRASRFIS